MKKQILNLGKALSKKEQTTVFGGVIKAYQPSLCSEGTLKLCETSSDCCNSEKCLLTTRWPGNDYSTPFDATQVGGGPNWETKLRCR